MKKENILLILWIIFGFIFISGIDSILYLITFLIYFVKSELGLPYTVIAFSMPIITLTLYILTTLLIFKKVKSKSNEIILTKFPKKVLIYFSLIALTLYPIANKLSGLYPAYSTKFESIEPSEFLMVHGWMIFGVHFSRWVIIITLIIVLLRKYKLIEYKN
jgi:hypothetical protein